MNIAIVIPTYNESGNIIELINKIFISTRVCSDVNFQLFVVDDSSPDNTSEIVKSYSNDYLNSDFQITVFNRAKKEGLGAAYIDAFNRIFSMDKKFDFILQMDADLSHDPIYIPLFIKSAARSDFIVGSRYKLGGGTPDWLWYRRYISKFGNLYARLILDYRMSDYTGGYNLYSSSLLNKDLLAKVSTKGYGFLISLKYFVLLKSSNFSEVPIIFNDRKKGVSKMPLNTFLHNLILVLKIKFSK
jgi:dolichol-phosphate mannosyltransferase